MPSAKQIEHIPPDRKKHAPKEPKHGVVESQRHIAAFERYLAMGDSRSLKRLAEEVGIALQTAEIWSKKFGWQKRMKHIKQENAEVEFIESAADQRKNRTLQLKIIDRMIRDSVVLDEDGNIVDTKVQAKSTSDLRMLIATRNEILYPSRPGASTSSGSGGTQNIQNAVFIIKK